MLFHPVHSVFAYAGCASLADIVCQNAGDAVAISSMFRFIKAFRSPCGAIARKLLFTVGAHEGNGGGELEVIG